MANGRIHAAYTQWIRLHMGWMVNVGISSPGLITTEKLRWKHSANSELVLTETEMWHEIFCGVYLHSFTHLLLALCRGLRWPCDSQHSSTRELNWKLYVSTAVQWLSMNSSQTFVLVPFTTHTALCTGCCICSVWSSSITLLYLFLFFCSNSPSTQNHWGQTQHTVIRSDTSFSLFARPAFPLSICSCFSSLLSNSLPLLSSPSLSDTNPLWQCLHAVAH